MKELWTLPGIRFFLAALFTVMSICLILTGCGRSSEKRRRPQSGRRRNFQGKRADSKHFSAQKFVRSAKSSVLCRRNNRKNHGRQLYRKAIRSIRSEESRVGKSEQIQAEKACRRNGGPPLRTALPQPQQKSGGHTRLVGRREGVAHGGYPYPFHDGASGMSASHGHPLHPYAISRLFLSRPYRRDETHHRQMGAARHTL